MNGDSGRKSVSPSELKENKVMSNTGMILFLMNGEEIEVKKLRLSHISICWVLSWKTGVHAKWTWIEDWH